VDPADPQRKALDAMHDLRNQTDHAAELLVKLLVRLRVDEAELFMLRAKLGPAPSAGYDPSFHDEGSDRRSVDQMEAEQWLSEHGYTDLLAALYGEIGESPLEG
jgi:hypothetical protein